MPIPRLITKNLFYGSVHEERTRLEALDLEVGDVKIVKGIIKTYIVGIYRRLYKRGLMVGGKNR